MTSGQREFIERNMSLLLRVSRARAWSIGEDKAYDAALDSLIRLARSSVKAGRMYTGGYICSAMYRNIVKACRVSEKKAIQVSYGRDYSDDFLPSRCRSPVDGESVRNAIDDLSPRLGEIVRRYYFDDATNWEIADELGVDESRVSQLRSRAVAELKCDPRIREAAIVAVGERLLLNGREKRRQHKPIKIKAEGRIAKVKPSSKSKGSATTTSPPLNKWGGLAFQGHARDDVGASS